MKFLLSLLFTMSTLLVSAVSVNTDVDVGNYLYCIDIEQPQIELLDVADVTEPEQMIPDGRLFYKSSCLKRFNNDNLTYANSECDFIFNDLIPEVVFEFEIYSINRIAVFTTNYLSSVNHFLWEYDIITNELLNPPDQNSFLTYNGSSLDCVNKLLEVELN